MSQIIWVPRTTWGSSASTESFIVNRVSDDPEKKTEIHIHHTASVDDDDTPNRWDYDEAVAYMRRLQWVRPDLGPLPYSENLAVSEDLETVWVFEGRGILTRGAHTGGHNIPGVGWAVFGNFSRADPVAAAAAVKAIESRVVHYRQSTTPSLGDTKSPNGWDAWGHRDSKATTCPGDSLYPLLADFTLEETMTPEQQAALDWLVDARASQSGDDPPWGANKWEEYLTEWSGKPGPQNPVTHIQLAHIYHELQKAVAADGGITTDQLDAAFAAHAANPDAHHA